MVGAFSVARDALVGSVLEYARFHRARADAARAQSKVGARQTLVVARAPAPVRGTFRRTDAPGFHCARKIPDGYEMVMIGRLISIDINRRMNRHI